jgi:DNA-binding response OmpR family regulator
LKILLVEDEPNVAAFIRKGLLENGYDVDAVGDGTKAKVQMAVEKYDLVILDVILPDSNGVKLCQDFKSRYKTPVLLLTALGTVDDKVKGLDAGADDYLVKPFHFQELLARIRVINRRREITSNEKVYRIADLEVYEGNRLVKRGEKSIMLTAREFKLLLVFIKNEGKILTRQQLAESVWDINFDTGTNVVDVYVNYLRNKIDKFFEPRLIHTVVGMGYVMKTL